MEITLRNYKPEDITSIVTLFRGTVHMVNAKDYSQDQINAWAPEDIDVEKWKGKLLRHHTVVAECNGVICGFGDIDDTGYFDHLFVHKDYQGCGIATQIVAAIESYAKQEKFKVITVAVSITAKPFFLSKGYIVVKEQEVEYKGQKFINFSMKKEMSF
ncbi:MAG: GNAT family N-acetyltransferase [Flavobacterium sp. MedPE-SWcel]|uniref:GNAT family N-acetyltransferase n=1 Tax=uncultured Flavobacterium sp. TaxID=165435 RepID=UPI000918FBEB|nr:GNAT family N-acetyltransferase [uncultured Flavobacterium sp.]OIQ22532.1 MAG: GNAT family N-acetyltransferase [Flavobacterium sp. MedPE-SWcel]